MKAGITLDDWKLPIFRDRLTAAGFEYKDGGEFSPSVTLLTVETEEVDRLRTVLESCQAACKKHRRS